MRPQITWYFDFISPYAWLQSRQLKQFSGLADIEFRPILFAGLLKHWGQLGPAEIVPKRQWTFEQIAWLANQTGAPLKGPPAHPFNPLPFLRACLAAGPNINNIEKIFAFIWEHGHAVEYAAEFNILLAELNIKSSDLEEPAIKKALLDNTNQAIAQQVFGVPTVVLTTDRLSEQRFWGFDSTPMVLSALNGDAFWSSSVFLEASKLPQGKGRSQLKQ